MLTPGQNLLVMPSVDPLFGGIIAGLLHSCLSPDHLCTIITLSACQGSEAFWFGVRWAQGHVVGMSVVCLVVTALNISAGGAAFSMYEHYADYVVGFLLIIFGTYFLLHADKYFDVEWNPKQATCACHGALATNDDSSEEHAGHAHKQSENSFLMGLDGADKTSKADSVRSMSSIAVGFLQGICCPAGLVGILFLKQYNLWQMAIFVSVFFAVTILAMGTLAMLYGILTREYIHSGSVARGLYYSSCCFSITMGIVWVCLNLSGNLNLVGHNHDHAHTNEQILFLMVAP